MARTCVQRLTEHGIAVRLLADEAADLGLAAGLGADGLVETTQPDDVPGEGCELVLVIGGDGSILRAAELTHETSTPAARREPRARRVPRRGRAGGRRVHDRRDRRPRLHRRGPADPRRAGAGGQGGAVHDLRPQRGQRREGRPRADARGRRRGRRATAVAVGLRRRRVRHPDRLDRLQLQRRRARGVARGRGPADGAAERARALRPSDGGRADLGARRRGALQHRRLGRAVVRRASHGRPAARGPHRGPPRRPAGAAGPPAPGAVHRPAGREVRPPGRGLARCGRAPAPRRRRRRGSDRHA